VPPERGYGQSDPTRVRRWSRGRFPEHVVLKAGKLVRFTDNQGRWHLVHIVRVGSKAVLVDTNHRWDGQTLLLEVELIDILDPGPTRWLPTSPVRCASISSPSSPATSLPLPCLLTI
jgi:FKBP-type peptidyl-prolyl cis-trans isomerase SlpA